MLRALLLGASILAAAKASSVHSSGDWGYGDDNGPSTWGKDCREKSQSPIALYTCRRSRDDDICSKFVKAENSIPMKRAIRKAVHSYATLDGKTVDFSLANNGHSAQVNVIPKNKDTKLKPAKIEGKQYRLGQFHFHWGRNNNEGSEHTQQGSAYPVEIHMVHYDTQYATIAEAHDKPNGLAVFGVFVKVGEKNIALNPVFSALGNITNKGDNMVIPSFSLRSLFPRKINHFYRYHGSLTTPPCSETVIWTVFRREVTASEDQIDELRKLRREGGKVIGHNFRPTQPINDRIVATTF